MPNGGPLEPAQKKGMQMTRFASLLILVVVGTASAETLENVEKILTTKFAKHKSFSADMKMTMQMGPGMSANSTGTMEFMVVDGKERFRSEMHMKMSHGTQTMETTVVSIYDGTDAYTISEMMGQKRVARTNPSQMAGRAGGIPLQMSDGVGGFLIESVEECAEAVLRLLRDEQLSSELGQLGKERVREHFLLPRLLLNELSLVRDLLEGRTTARDEMDGYRDPVCGMAISLPDSAVTLTYAGLEFSFCSEACRGQFIEFMGADDAWMFVDTELAMDLGGIVPETEQVVELDRLGLQDGEVYDLRFFFAHRYPETPAFHLRTNVELWSDAVVVAASYPCD